MPKHRLLGLLVAALTIVPAASAMAGPTVSVRVEGKNATLLPTTTVTLPDVKAAGNPCSGATASTSVAAALEEATHGNWDHQAFTQTILGETHKFDNSDDWAEWVDEKFGGGICNDTVQNGDRVLFIADTYDANYNPTVFPLTLTAPATAKPGAPFSVSATEYQDVQDSSGYAISGQSTPRPAAGAQVTGGAANATTGSDGKASVTITQRGPATLRATTANGERSDLVPVCVTDGADGFCGTVAPGQTTSSTPPPAAPVTPVTPAAPDRVAAFAKIGSIAEREHFAHGSGPRTLQGRVDDDASGVKDVRMRLSRTDGKHCTRYDGTRERFVTTHKCGIKHARTFSVGSSADFSYLLPSALPRGRYVLDVIVIDRAGNQTTTYQRGRNRVVFYVG